MRERKEGRKDHDVSQGKSFLEVKSPRMFWKAHAGPWNRNELGMRARWVELVLRRETEGRGPR